MRRTSIILVLGLLMVFLAGCQGDANEVRLEEKGMSGVLVKSLAEIAPVAKGGGTAEERRDPRHWAEYQVSELSNLISWTNWLLNNLQYGGAWDQLVSNQSRWEQDFRPLLEQIDQREVRALTSDINQGFGLVLQAHDRNSASAPEAAAVFAGLSQQIPQGMGDKNIVINDIHHKLLLAGKTTTEEEAVKRLGGVLVVPQYLPDRFEKYGVFVEENRGIPTQPMVRTVWLDAHALEVLMLTQSPVSGPDCAEPILYTDDLQVPGKISHIFSWAQYCGAYQFTREGQSVQGYMLVNEETSRDDCEKILNSMSLEKKY